MRAYAYYAPITNILIWVDCTVTLGHDVVQARANAEGQYWVLGPIVARVWGDAKAICCHQGPLGVCRSKPCQCPTTTICPGPCWSGWPILLPGAVKTSWHRLLLPMAMSESVALWKPPVYDSSCHHGLCRHLESCNLWPCWCSGIQGGTIVVLEGHV